MFNSSQVGKNLPLKKRRAYVIDSTALKDDQDENYSDAMKQSYGKEDPLQLRLQTPSAVPTPPSSPHIELLRQQYAYLLANATNTEHRLYPQPSTYECLLAQKALAQQFLDGYRSLMDHHAHSQSTIEDRAQPSNLTIDEHFRKSLGNTYDRLATGFLTPDYASSNSSPIERTPADSIEEHFARSLAKFLPAMDTEAVVDDHFAKALGATTWEKLKERS